VYKDLRQKNKSNQRGVIKPYIHHHGRGWTQDTGGGGGVTRGGTTSKDFLEEVLLLYGFLHERRRGNTHPKNLRWADRQGKAERGTGKKTRGRVKTITSQNKN